MRTYRISTLFGKCSEDRMNQMFPLFQTDVDRRFIAHTTNEKHSRQGGDSQCRSNYGQSHPEGHINALLLNVYFKWEMDRMTHEPRKDIAKKSAKR
eukprot:5647827-Heterocapsa_arctica.AAC.1